MQGYLDNYICSRKKHDGLNSVQNVMKYTLMQSEVSESELSLNAGKCLFLGSLMGDSTAITRCL